MIMKVSSLCLLGNRKKELDNALVSMIVKDTQPFSIVDDQGFRDFVAILDPNYVLPTRKVY